jgi:cytochrome c oxidase assembly factor CtaG
LWGLLSFVFGIFTIWIAIGSPLDGFADATLSAHMVEHLLLMSVAPPLLLLGSPSVPFLRGLPRMVTVRLIGPLLRSKALRSIGTFFMVPGIAWLVMNITFLGWHGSRGLCLRAQT